MIITVWHCGAPEHEERCTPEQPGHLPSPRAKRRQNTFFCGGVDRAIRCDNEGCNEEVELNDSRWTLIRASSVDGWFFRQDGTLHLCFGHLTIGLIAWRDRSNPGWRGRLRKGLAEKLPTVDSARRVASSTRVGYNGSGSSATLPRGGSDEQGQS
jgi:hypothetical protein